MILIIDENRKRRETIAETFYYMGILSYGVCKDGALSELSRAYKAILISEPQELADCISFLRGLREAARDIPLFAISEYGLDVTLKPLFDLEFKSGIYSSLLAREIIDYSRREGLVPIGSYMLAGLDVSCDRSYAKYFSREVKLTKTEAMILRYLIASYPAPVSAQDVLTHAYKQTKAPEDAAVRTQISLINRKFDKVKSERLITRTDTGYLIATPEFLEKQKTE